MKIPTASKGDDVPPRSHKCKTTFPLDVFPPDIQRVITEAIECLQFHPDFMGAAMLSALAHATGTSYRAEPRRKHTEPAILWIGLVGDRGIGKTHAIEFLLKPFNSRDKAKFKDYQQRLDEFDAEGKGKRPRFRQAVLTNTTYEAIVDCMDCNPKGIIIFADELLSFTGNFNRYNKGNDESYILTLFSGHPLAPARKTQDPVYVSQSCVNMIGGIQPQILRKVVTPDRIMTGFADRFLFVCPEAESSPWDAGREFDDLVFDRYSDIVNALLDIPSGSADLSFTHEAKTALFQWQNVNNELANQYRKEFNPLSGTLKKWDSYLIRFALILEATAAVCRGETPKAISLDSVNSAIRLFDYFLGEFKKALNLADLNPILHELKPWQLDLFKALPEAFVTKEAVDHAKALEIDVTDRSVMTFLANRKLFENPKKGSYAKAVKA